ncbi:hypothetical protein [Acidithiobacillus sp. AMEEHan]|uniref:hypothetical protein n=1 Tax=Acidithiobacillus sp. AMEEHan TaxID=2994951 RepID=UPI0027E3FB97|nr:hypothetical protein [Acidithiobacillus sp. AMEEHan]
MTQSPEARSRQAIEGEQTYTEFLALLLQDEISCAIGWLLIIDDFGLKPLYVISGRGYPRPHCCVL